MKVVLDQVAKGAALPATSAAFESGRASLARAETEQRPTVLGPIASGRMRPDDGSVTSTARPTTARCADGSPSSTRPTSRSPPPT
ncbi:hypothetical protein ACRAWC_20470 [Leifsonia sp. L25]|uniref:hypothetical protein n=1 Tax=Leifsonia sp. L25 TaxID=3423957 RepID=UPI003D689EE7